MANEQNTVLEVSVSLFERLGGTPGITKIVEGVINEHMNNDAIKHIFLPYKDEPEKLAVILGHTVDFFSAGSGGPVEYKGRDMVTTHKGMNISSEHYMCVIDDILKVLGDNNIDEKSKNEVLAILWSLKGMIMGQ